MDWNQSTMYEQRVRFILEVQQRTFSFAESCRRWHQQGRRIQVVDTVPRGGIRGTPRPLSPAPPLPACRSGRCREHVVDLRQRYGWGSRKIRKLTAEKFGEAPARRTIDRIFEGLITEAPTLR